MRRLDRKNELDDVFEQMQKMFNQFHDLTDLRSNVPVDVKEEDGMIVINAELPGVDKEQINLKADSEGIEIMAESSAEMKEENEKYLRRERTSRTFRRRVAWPTDVDPETVEASYEDGILTVSAEKEESDDNWDVEIN